MKEIANRTTKAIYENNDWHVLESKLAKIIRHAIEHTLAVSLQAHVNVQQMWFDKIATDENVERIIREATEPQTCEEIMNTVDTRESNGIGRTSREPSPSISPVNLAEIKSIISHLESNLWAALDAYTQLTDKINQIDSVAVQNTSVTKSNSQSEYLRGVEDMAKAEYNSQSDENDVCCSCGESFTETEFKYHECPYD